MGVKTPIAVKESLIKGAGVAKTTLDVPADPAERSNNISEERLHGYVALTTSFLAHLVVSGVTITMQPTSQPAAIREYLPVDLVQMPSLPRSAGIAPSVARPAIPLRPLNRPAPAVHDGPPKPDFPPVAQKIAALSQPHNEASPAGSSPQARYVAALGNGAAGKDQSRTTGSAAPPVRSGAGDSHAQSQKGHKDSYQAFYKLTRLPSFRSRSEPVYPDTERMTGGEARVLAEIYLDEHGGVDDISIKKSGGKFFDKAVIDAVRQSSFHPGYMGEKPVPTVIQIPYLFKLK